MPLPNKICKIIKNYNYGTYIETGLAGGEGVEQALSLNFKKVISIDRYFDLAQVGYFNGDFYIKIRNMYGSCMIAKVINGLLKGIEGKKQIFVLGYEGVNDNEIDIFLTI